MIGDVSVFSSLADFEELRRRLSDVEREVLRSYEREMLEQYQDAWVGWKYDGRPPGAPRNVSQQAWQSRVVSTDRGAALVIENRARDWRKQSRAYVSHVHRAGSKALEWEVQRQITIDEIMPRLVIDLAEAVADAHEKPGPTRKIREGKGGEPVATATIRL